MPGRCPYRITASITNGVHHLLHNGLVGFDTDCPYEAGKLSGNSHAHLVSLHTSFVQCRKALRLTHLRAPGHGADVLKQILLTLL